MTIEELQSRELGPTDTFRFTCKQCGQCCRKRDSAIVVTGVDLYYMAKALEMKPEDVIKTYLAVVPGKDSKLPVVYLTERDDGSCKFLRKGKCSIQQNKPVVCRLFPLGRYYDVRDHKYHYFSQNGACIGSSGSTIRLKDWLEEFKIEPQSNEAILWAELLSASGFYMHEIQKKSVKRSAEFFFGCFAAFYSGHDMRYSCMENLLGAKKFLEKEFKGFKVNYKE